MLRSFGFIKYIIYIFSIKYLLDKDKNRENITNFDLKNKIDNLIYKSYDLTLEEVKKIDPNFKLTISQYKALEI